MENLLSAQKSLEEVEESIAKYLPKETIEVAHAQFLSRINTSKSDTMYLLAVGRPVIRPFSSRLENSRIKLARKGVVDGRYSRVTTSSEGNQKQRFVISTTIYYWLTHHFSH